MSISTPFFYRILRRFAAVVVLLVIFQQAQAAQQDSACGYIRVGKQQIYYCEKGSGPAVVLLHAGFLDMHVWDRFTDTLSRNHRVLRIDLPGHGRTLGRDTVIRIAELIREVMRQRKITKASFAGISLGASCVLEFAIAHPEMVSRVLLCSPGLNGWETVLKPDTLSKRVFVRSDTYFNTADRQLVAENYTHYWLDGPYRNQAEVSPEIRQYVISTAFDKLNGKIQSVPVFDKRKTARRVQLIRKPVLILYGSMDIPFTAQVSHYLGKKIKGAQVKVVEGGAHFFLLERPDIMQRYLLQWM